MRMIKRKQRLGGKENNSEDKSKLIDRRVKKIMA